MELLDVETREVLKVVAQTPLDFPAPRDVLSAPRHTLRPHIGGQSKVVDALYTAFKRTLEEGERAFFVLGGERGEGVGVGKTHMSIAVATALLEGKGRVLVLVPAHLLPKWQEEVEKEGFRAVVVKTARSLAEALGRKEEKTLFVLVSKDTAKRFPPRRPVALRWSHSRRYWGCPECFGPVDEPSSPPPQCPHCGTPLWQEEGKGKLPLGRALVRRAGEFDFLILDEGHAFRNEGTQQTLVAERLATRLPTLVVSGTLMGGFASELHFVLRNAYPELRKVGRDKFAAQYGARAEVVVKNLTTGTERVTRKEAPGFSPLLWPLLLQKGVFVAMSDIAKLPPLRSATEVIPLTEEQKAFLGAFRAELKKSRGSSSRAKLAHLATVAYLGVDVPWRVQRQARGTGNSRGAPHPLPRAPAQGRGPPPPGEGGQGARERVVVFVEGTGVWDASSRVFGVLWDAGYNPTLLTADVPPEKRMAFLREAEGDVLVVNPKLVETGLDLVEYTRAVFYQPPRSAFTLRQAERRFHRLEPDQGGEGLPPGLQGNPGAGAPLGHGEGPAVPDLRGTAGLRRRRGLAPRGLLRRWSSRPWRRRRTPSPSSPLCPRAGW